MKKDDKIFVAGHKGMVGSAIVRALKSQGFNNIQVKERSELDLSSQSNVLDFFNTEKPDIVFNAAAKVGGIMANKTKKGEFIYQNLQIQLNILEGARQAESRKLLFLGSSCIYPKMAPQPIKEEYLLTGHLEETNDAYAIAKIAGIMQCNAYREQYGSNFISVMPTNLYGPHDNFDLLSSHVLPALIHKFHNAKEEGHLPVMLWGSGTPRREFLFVDDLAEACLHFMNEYSGPEWLNIGTGKDITIKELAELIQEIVGHKGKINWDTSKPDGTPRKLLDVSRASELGWKSTTSLENGIRQSYQWFLENYQGA